MALSSSAEPDAYTYEPLPDQCFRLVNLGEKRNSNLAGGYEISMFQIEKCPRYHALSYCWGEPQRSDSIICNQSVVKVTLRLKEGLVELEAIPELRTWFWIDQICVNQDDDSERSCQVQLMPQIYSRSVRTIVWLGPKSKERSTEQVDDSVFEFAKDVFLLGQAKEELSYKPVFTSQNLPRGHRNWRGRLPRSHGVETPDDLLLFGLPSVSDPRWKSLALFFYAPWFSRVWVIQEVFFSPDVPYIIHNGQIRDFLHLLWAGSFISQNLATFRKRFLIPIPILRITEHARLILQLAFVRSKWSLGSLLWRTADYKATDQRDKFFALLNITGELRYNETGITHTLVPNYGTSSATVARDFTRYVIQASRSLLILSLINPGTQQEVEPPDGGPSWAYRASDTLAALRFGEQYILRGSPFEIQRKGHEACIQLPVQICPSKNPDVLILSGRHRGKIVETFTNNGMHKLLSWCEQGHRYLAQAKNLSLKQALAQIFITLSARHDFQGGDARPSIADFASWLLQRRATEQPIPSHFQAFISEFEEIAHHQPGNSHIMDRWIAVYEPGGDFQYRQFGITDNGDLLVGPQSMKPGDKVCLFDGGELPFVLRPFEEHYLLRGECYIHALNQSDAWKGLDKEKAEWFSLI